MPDDTSPTLTQVAEQYLATLADGERVAKQVEIQRFIRWCGADRTIDKLHGQEVANYGDTLTGGVTYASGRADDVRAFLSFARKAGHTATNLGTHLRLRKGAGSKKSPPPKAAPKEVPLSMEERVAREAELASLKAQRPKLQADIKRAMEDKDFRENAPLDAARQQKSYIEGRIQEIEALLANAVTVEAAPAQIGDAVAVGTTVVLRNLTSGVEQTFTLAWPTEVNATQGRISVESPVGHALLDRRPGDEVEVTAPSGTLRFRIERVEP